jgi:hypothetical protein
MRTARSFSSGGYRLVVGLSDVIIHPHFQGTEPPGIPGQFSPARQGSPGPLATAPDGPLVTQDRDLMAEHHDLDNQLFVPDRGTCG